MNESEQSADPGSNSDVGADLLVAHPVTSGLPSIEETLLSTPTEDYLPVHSSTLQTSNVSCYGILGQEIVE